MACTCDSCSSPRIIKTRTATFWRWLAESRGETADRVIPAPSRALVSAGSGFTEPPIAIETAEASTDPLADDADGQELDRRRAEFLKIVGRGGRI